MSDRIFTSGERLTVAVAIVDAHDRGNLAVRIGSRMVHVDAQNLLAAVAGGPGPAIVDDATPAAPRRRRGGTAQHA